MLLLHRVTYQQAKFGKVYKETTQPFKLDPKEILTVSYCSLRPDNYGVSYFAYVAKSRSNCCQILLKNGVELCVVEDLVDNPFSDFRVE